MKHLVGEGAGSGGKHWLNLTKSTSALAGLGSNRQQNATKSMMHIIVVNTVGFHIHRVGEGGREEEFNYAAYFFFL